MQYIVAVSIVIAVGGCSVQDEGGPAQGTWQLDTSPNEGWYCVVGGQVCTPPPYFSPPPMTVDLPGGGVLDWGTVEQEGEIDGACIRVAPGIEQGIARTAVTFCNLIEGGVVDETRAFAIIGWSPGSGNECNCSAHFDHGGG